MSTPGKKEDNPFSFTNIFAEDTPPAPKPKAKKKVCNRYFETSRLRCYPGLRRHSLCTLGGGQKQSHNSLPPHVWPNHGSC